MTLAEAATVLRGLAARGPSRPGTIDRSRDGALLRLTIDNPTASNAITASMLADLAEAVEEAHRRGIAAVLLQSSGGPFCAGGHLEEVQESWLEPEAARAMATSARVVLDALWQGPTVAVAAVDGLAIGGGAELLTAMDFRFIGPTGAVQFVHSRLGVAPGWGGTGRLVALLGRTRALDLLLRAQRLDRDAAVRIGLAEPSDERSGKEAAEGFLAEIAARAPAVVRAQKRQVAASLGLRRQDETEAFLDVWGAPAHRAALDALRAKKGLS